MSAEIKPSKNGYSLRHVLQMSHRQLMIIHMNQHQKNVFFTQAIMLCVNSACLEMHGGHLDIETFSSGSNTSLRLNIDFQCTAPQLGTTDKKYKKAMNRHIQSSARNSHAVRTSSLTSDRRFDMLANIESPSTSSRDA